MIAYLDAAFSPGAAYAGVSRDRCLKDCVPGGANPPSDLCPVRLQIHSPRTSLVYKGKKPDCLGVEPK